MPPHEGQWTTTTGITSGTQGFLVAAAFPPLQLPRAPVRVTTASLIVHGHAPTHMAAGMIVITLPITTLATRALDLVWILTVLAIVCLTPRTTNFADAKGMRMATP